MVIRLLSARYSVIFLRGALFLIVLLILLNSVGYGASSETVPLDIYLCVDVSDSVLLRHKNELIRTLSWTFEKCLKDVPDGDKLAVILFAENSGVYRELRVMETADFYRQGDELRPQVLKKLETTISKEPIKFQDKRSNKDVTINREKTRFRETNLRSLVQTTDTNFQPRELLSRKSVVMFLTDGEEDSDDAKPETEIRGIRDFDDMFYIGPQNNLVQSVRFVFFIVSHSQRGKADRIEYAWRSIFEPHFACFRYYDLSQLFGNSNDDFGTEITEVFDWLRSPSAIAFYLEKPLTYIPNTTTIGTLIFRHASTLKEGKLVSIELESLSSDELPFGIHFPEGGYSRSVWIEGTEGIFNSRTYLDIETSGLVPEYCPNQEFRVKFSSEDAEVEVALNPKAIIVPIDEEPLKFNIDYDYQQAVSMSEFKEKKYQELAFHISQTSSVHQTIFCYYRPPRNGDERQKVNKIKANASWQTKDTESPELLEEDVLQIPFRIPPHSQLKDCTLTFEFPNNPGFQQFGKKCRLYGGTFYFAQFPGPPPYIPINSHQAFKKMMFSFLSRFTAPTTNKMEFTILVKK